VELFDEAIIKMRGRVIKVQVDVGCNLQHSRRGSPPKNIPGQARTDVRTQLHGYRLDVDLMCNTLWRLRDSGHIKDRVVSGGMAFDTITRIYCLHAHPGKNKTLDLLREEYYGIKEVGCYILSIV